jgi:hypothetical protein
MLRWAVHHITWFIIRIVVTAACIFTVNNVIAEEGYRVAYMDLSICTACLIVLMRFWLPKSYDKKDPKEPSWGG